MPARTHKITVMIVDDHAILRAGLKTTRLGSDLVSARTSAPIGIARPPLVRVSPDKGLHY
jgi:DNA-binding NarL/FixJ family response regulator